MTKKSILNFAVNNTVNESDYYNPYDDEFIDRLYELYEPEVVEFILSDTAELYIRFVKILKEKYDYLNINPKDFTPELAKEIKKDWLKCQANFERKVKSSLVYTYAKVKFNEDIADLVSYEDNEPYLKFATLLKKEYDIKNIDEVTPMMVKAIAVDLYNCFKDVKK